MLADQLGQPRDKGPHGGRSQVKVAVKSMLRFANANMQMYTHAQMLSSELNHKKQTDWASHYL